MSTWTKYQLDRRSLRQARKAIPAVTCWLPLGYCRNLGELVPVKGGIISSSLFLIEGNPILPITPRDGCDTQIRPNCNKNSVCLPKDFTRTNRILHRHACGACDKFHVCLDERRGVQENTSMRLREFPRAQPKATPETECWYLFVLPDSSQGTDSV